MDNHTFCVVSFPNYKTMARMLPICDEKTYVIQTIYRFRNGIFFYLK